ncbi:Flp1 family type IVb pilin [Inconstantimicrobium mannanitabidum]|uniref:Uncharacterized protein n=1 Tax=Inconstantimicrobium mannanitabidum TaxID=1604901 RepID=A0ACB5RDT6_9CLOT|nr:Flp1 family type IVb pilin [Clostridium sp. TW13]GKX67428.1 hypothetical protein rsdtw13_26860 [Clostridium sp. TW13]
MEITKRFFKEEEGVATIEIVLILVILIGLVLVFKQQIGALLTKIFTKINNSANSVIG